ncbi:hypothetical protein Pmani_034571 [Petrolisthes manimaculis]|uniref:Uncharacterized protein n=1 Tax=Petrolisthes manimaculis TaxID=1843537 RepID=A0AAE1NP30_9EUCA|nr:hypothetical protein Pmani_034571 [Petrolisthes manimaculis]
MKPVERGVSSGGGKRRLLSTLHHQGTLEQYKKAHLVGLQERRGLSSEERQRLRLKKKQHTSSTITEEGQRWKVEKRSRQTTHHEGQKKERREVYLDPPPTPSRLPSIADMTKVNLTSSK